MSARSNKESSNEAFSSNVGLILSCMGCMVGTGNIWRFPRILAQNSGDKGGLVFMLIWLMFLFLWSIPMIIVEYGLGRYTGKAVLQSFRQLVGDKVIWCAGWITVIPILIGFWYSVVLGWCFYFAFQCVAFPLPINETDSKLVFDQYAVDSSWPVLTHALAIGLACLSAVKGGKTIGNVNMFLVPVFLCLILITFIWSLTRTFAVDGIRFLFTPNWESFIDPRTWVDALSQNAFDTGAGMGLIHCYASYMTSKNGIVRYGTLIPATNNFISLICGITIFGIVFSVLRTTDPGVPQSEIITILKDSGPASTGLTFIWIPVLYSTIGPFGRALAVVYFLCLSFAGLTSLISHVEFGALTLHGFGVPRCFGIPAIFLIYFLGGLPSALSIVFLTNQDFVWAFSLLISGLSFQAVIILYGVNKFRTRVVNDFGDGDWYLPKVWAWIILFIAPIEAAFILIWWAVNLMSTKIEGGIAWYEFGPESFLSTVVQWSILLLILASINLVVIYCRPSICFKHSLEEQPLELDKDEIGSVMEYGSARNIVGPVTEEVDLQNERQNSDSKEK